MVKPTVEVKGKTEVVRAFGKLSDSASDMTPANQEIARKLTGEIKQRTRRRSGTLQAGWGADPSAKGVAFSNPQSYALAQEYGAESRNISPTNAVRLVFEAHADDITGAYADAIRDKARRANIDTKAR